MIKIACPFCKKLLINNSGVDYNSFCINCPYHYSQFGFPSLIFYSFTDCKYTVDVNMYDDGTCLSNIIDVVESKTVCNIAEEIKPCSEERIKLFILFS